MPHPLVDTVAAFSDRHALLDEGPVLVAASGGVDSMTCLSVLRRLDVDVHALHVNYGLRAGA
ncbi:7-cyano-7-deazaguanine synthase, partial [Salinibacter ruber]